jgi:hypothetical protein
MRKGETLMGDLARHGDTMVAGAAVEVGDLIQLDTTNNWPYGIKTAASTDVVIGICLQAAAAGEAFQVGMTRGVYMCRSSAAISEEARIAPAADGEIVTADAAKESVGIALEASTAADQDVRCLLFAGDHLVA